MPFKSEAQRRWMHANEPEMADEWEKHTPKGEKLPERVKKKKSESVERKLDGALSESGLVPIMEARSHRPAVITMKSLSEERIRERYGEGGHWRRPNYLGQADEGDGALYDPEGDVDFGIQQGPARPPGKGTVIPVHHFRRFISPTTGRAMIAAGIDPGQWEMINNGQTRIIQSLRDFMGPSEWIPNRLHIRRGQQDETGWSEPDENGYWSATREFRYIRKFRKILTIYEENIWDIKLLDPGVDPKLYEPDQSIRRGRGNGTKIG
jgi:hypothetical protein